MAHRTAVLKLGCTPIRTAGRSEPIADRIGALHSGRTPHLYDFQEAEFVVMAEISTPARSSWF